MKTMYGYYTHTINRHRREIEQAIAEIGAGMGRRFTSDALQIWALLCLWQRRDVARRQLATMPAHNLADMGILQADANAEAAKGFWRA
jgi:uncharacterized protein YjiS (DUF1127 family)